MERQPASSPQLNVQRHDAEPTRSAAEQTKEQAQRMKSQAIEAGQQAKQQVTDMAQQAGQAMRQHGSQLIDNQKRRLVEQISGARDATQAAATKLRGDHDDNIAAYVEGVATYLDRAQQYLNDRDGSALLRDAQDLARKKPAWFLGGMFVAGVAIARFAKAERPEQSSHDGGSRSSIGGESYQSRSGTSPSPGSWTSDVDETATSYTSSTARTISNPGQLPDTASTSGPACDVGGLVSGQDSEFQSPGKELQ